MFVPKCVHIGEKQAVTQHCRWLAAFGCNTIDHLAKKEKNLTHSLASGSVRALHSDFSMRRKQMQCHSSCTWKQAALWKHLVKSTSPRLCLTSEWWNPQVLLFPIAWEMCELCFSIPHVLAAFPKSSGLLPSQPGPAVWPVTWAG